MVWCNATFAHIPNEQTWQVLFICHLSAYKYNHRDFTSIVRFGCNWVEKSLEKKKSKQKKKITYPEKHSQQKGSDDPAITWSSIETNDDGQSVWNSEKSRIYTSKHQMNRTIPVEISKICLVIIFIGIGNTNTTHYMNNILFCFIIIDRFLYSFQNIPSILLTIFFVSMWKLLPWTPFVVIRVFWIIQRTRTYYYWLSSLFGLCPQSPGKSLFIKLKVNNKCRDVASTWLPRQCWYALIPKQTSKGA